MLRSLTAAALILVGLPAAATETTASITVPASSLVFKGEGLQAPDEEGNFGIGIKLPIAHVKASKCDTPYLATGLGTMNKPLDELSDTDKKMIAHLKAEYDALVAASKAGKTVTLHFRNTPTYLRVKDGVLYVPYCILSMVDAEGSLMISPTQARDAFVVPALTRLGLDSLDAEKLLMGTAAIESNFHLFIQRPGPARGMFQMEPPTFDDLTGCGNSQPRRNIN